MRRGKFTGFFERAAVIEELARKFYKMQGCDYPADKNMLDATHPQEKLCVLMAIEAVDRLCISVEG